MHDLRGVLVGAGYFAQHQLDGWSRVVGARIAALCDLDAAKAEAMAARFGVPRTYRSLDEALERERPDFVDIVTRPESHLELVETAAARGAAILCQKPVAPTLEESVHLVRRCEALGVPLMINENWRWQPWYRRIRGLIDEGRIGRIFHARALVRPGDGRGPRPYAHQPYFSEMPRFIIFEMLVHFLDTFRFLFGEVEWVFARTRRINPVIRGEDLAVVHLAFAGGVEAVIDANRFSDYGGSGVAFGTLSIEGEEGHIDLDMEGRVRLQRVSEPPEEYRFPTEVGYRGDSCRATQQHFVDVLRRGGEFETSGRTYLQTVAVVEACYRSAEERRTVAPAELLSARAEL